MGAGKALIADPNNLDVLLSLGVSHTNELDHSEALTYLTRWIQTHPDHMAIAEAAGPPLDSSQVGLIVAITLLCVCCFIHVDIDSMLHAMRLLKRKVLEDLKLV
jgi:hypothetical protein